MTNDAELRPNWISPPGETIRDILELKGLNESEFVSLLGRSQQDVTALLEGRAAISLEMARSLEATIGASSAFWIARDVQYREDAARLHPQDVDWLKTLPIRDMVRFGWVSPVSPSDETEACLRFFNQPSVDAWRDAYAGIRATAFRTSQAFESDLGATAAWLREGEVRSQEIGLGRWDPEGFAAMLNQIRPVTRLKSPDAFIPRLQERCAAFGVAVVVLRAPTGCRASGATRFISSDRALILLSFRYLTDDHFWFTFFHEAGHLLLHAERRLFPDQGNESWILEVDDDDAMTNEGEANEFAARTLIPEEYEAEMRRLPRRTEEILRFARRVGVSPGVVVGQLQHRGVFAQNQMNRLKRRFHWSE